MAGLEDKFTFIQKERIIFIKLFFGNFGKNFFVIKG